MKDLVIAGAIFDLDGTLLDSMHIWRDFASAYLLSRGITPPEDLEDRIGPLTLREAAEYLRNAFSLPEPLEEVLAGMDAAARALYETVLPKPGVPALLAGMKAAGIPMAVATLTDPACIVFCEDVDVDDDVIAKAQANDITIAKSPLSAYALCTAYHTAENSAS